MSYIVETENINIPETQYVKKFNFWRFISEILRIKKTSAIGVGWMDAYADLSLIGKMIGKSTFLHIQFQEDLYFYLVIQYINLTFFKSKAYSSFENIIKF